LDRTNLGRQIIHDEGVIDELKTVSAAAKIHALNPDVAVKELGRLEGDALRGAIEAVDVVVECSDSIPTKFAVNDAALAAGVPAVIGGILRWEGQVMVVERGAACWRCLFEQEPTPEEMPPACSEAGVLGALAGVIGSIQAVEAMKLLLVLDGSDDAARRERPQSGRITIYDAWEGKTREVEVSPRAGCPACGPHR
jgi:adenylyltransferase/sulfurtransferase